MSYPTRAAARVAAYNALVSEAHFRLIKNHDGTWDWAEAEVSASERMNPTFEFFNENDVRTAELGRLYKAAVSLGFENPCVIKRETLVHDILLALNASHYPLDREVPPEAALRPTVQRQRRAPNGTGTAAGSVPTARPQKAGPVAQVWAVCDKLSEGGKQPQRKDVLAECKKLGVNDSTASVQFGKWKKFLAAQAAKQN